MAEIRSYGEPSGDPELGSESARDLEAITDHIIQWWGNIETTFHEIKSDYVHIDVHWIKPVPDHPYHTLITSGMSDRPMRESKDLGGSYAELLIALPPDWPIDAESFKNERNYWPIRHLKQTARFPHVYKTLLSYGHTIANEGPLQNYAEDVGFCAGILSFPFLCDEEGWTLKVNDEKTIRFLSFVPIYKEELLFSRAEGSEKLFDMFDDAGITELIDKRRKNVCV